MSVKKGFLGRAVVDLEHYMQSERFVDLDRDVVHKGFLEVTMAGGEVPKKKVDSIFDRQISFFGTNPLSGVSFRAERERFRDKVWPEMWQHIAKSPGLVPFMLEYGVYSRFIPTFLADTWAGRLSLAVLPAHGVGRDLCGDLRPIPHNDAMTVFCATDASYRGIRFRAECMQKEMRQAKRVFLPGGGIDPVLWTRDYPLGRIGQEVVLCDREDMSAYLEQAIGEPLVQTGVTYLHQSFLELMHDEAQYGRYDCILLSGVATYYIEQLKDILAGLSKLLAPGGLLMLDLQIMHPVYLFDCGVLGWPQTMKPEPSVKDAIDRVQALCTLPELELRMERAQHETVPPGDTPAVAVFWLRKQPWTSPGWAA